MGTREEQIREAEKVVVEAAKRQGDLARKVGTTDILSIYREAIRATNAAVEALDALTRPPTARDVIEAVRKCSKGFYTPSGKYILDELLDDLERRLQ